MNSLTVISFDLAWAGKTGWAVIDWCCGSYTSVKTGTIESSIKKKGTDAEIAKAVRAHVLEQQIYDVLATTGILGVEHVVVCYESALSWLLAASRASGRRKPVTRNSLMASAFSIACFWAAFGRWLTETNEVGWHKGTKIQLKAVDTRSARAAFGVDDLPAQRAKLDEIEAMKGYADRKKALVGLAVATRLESEGLGFIVLLTDHEADAVLFGLVVADQAVLEMRTV